jgi:hypothetical protein
MSKWGSETDTYMLEYTGRDTLKGWWFLDPAGDGEEALFLPESVVIVLERNGEEAGDVWTIEIPNWLAKAKELI